MKICFLRGDCSPWHKIDRTKLFNCCLIAESLTEDESVKVMRTQLHRAIDQRREPQRFHMNYSVLILQDALC